jgi:hypothetical protein
MMKNDQTMVLNKQMVICKLQYHCNRSLYNASKLLVVERRTHSVIHKVMQLDALEWVEKSVQKSVYSDNDDRESESRFR